MTKVEYDGDVVEYDGDNPLRLANEIDAALAKYGSGSDHHMCKAIHFFEGELRLIAECLRCAGPPKVASQPLSTHGVATQEEIEKYLKQFKKMHEIPTGMPPPPNGGCRTERPSGRKKKKRK